MTVAMLWVDDVDRLYDEISRRVRLPSYPQQSRPGGIARRIFATMTALLCQITSRVPDIPLSRQTGQMPPSTAVCTG